MFKKGTMINKTIEIIDFIGSGGQGEVYKVRFNNELYALKWYYPNNNQEFKKTLHNLILKGAPNDCFLWPLLLVEENNRFGYLMELRPKEYRSLTDWITQQFDMNLTALAKACFKLTDSFHNLHASGFSYKDISPANIFIEPESGNILICDNDNITPNGMRVNNLLGTPKFMAPEIVEGGMVPNTETDQFSLAVLLFYMLFIAHPFEGALETRINCFDEASAKQLYGYDAVYIFNKENDSNRPVPGIHNNPLKLWGIYPDYLKELFEKTFTIGIKAPYLRSRESQWRKAFFKMYNSLFKCGNCGMENFYDLEIIRTKGELHKCILCGDDLRLPPRIRINKQIIVLDDNKEIYENHLDQDEMSNLTVIGYVRKINDGYYLYNVSKTNWLYRAGNDERIILPDESVILEDNSRINFSNVTGEIRL